MTDSCATCGYFSVGQCRYYPPGFTGTVNAQGFSGWPTVHGSDWCGHFAVTPQAQVAGPQGPAGANGTDGADGADGLNAPQWFVSAGVDPGGSDGDFWFDSSTPYSPGGGNIVLLKNKVLGVWQTLLQWNP